MYNARMSEINEPTIALEHTLRPTYVQVDLGQLAANYHAIQQHIGADKKVMVILKANAYGHGWCAWRSTCSRWAHLTLAWRI